MGDGHRHSGPAHAGPAHALPHHGDHGHKHESHGGGGQPYSERILLRTVGIDIGSSTTHVMFARLELERDGRRLSSAYRVVSREIDFQSPIFLTPYRDREHIDVEAVRVIVADQYARAGIAPEQIDSGAVIVTGEAAMKSNADPVVRLFAHEGGRFVCASAGPNLEATLAAHGSGAARASIGDGATLNVDIGGGTTKLAVCLDGKVVDTAALGMGARLVAWDVRGVVVRVERAAQRFTRGRVRVGDRIDESLVSAMVERMADVLTDAIGAAMEGRPHDTAGDHYITEPLRPWPSIHGLSFSGGVSTYIDDARAASFGDLGPALGAEIARRVTALGVPLRMVRDGIRATIIGASQYTVQVSGTTSIVSPGAGLPRRNVPVAVLDLRQDQPAGDPIARRIDRAFERLDLDPARHLAALACRWSGRLDYNSIARFCAEITRSRFGAASGDHPLVLLMDHDIAGIVGTLLHTEFLVARPVVVLDEIEMSDWGYVDIGDLDQERNVVPVVIKSLVFQ